jgi:hypothetical protein
MNTAYIGGNYTCGRVKVFLGLYRGSSVGANLVLNIPGSYYSAASLSSTYQLSSTTSIGAGYGAARNSEDHRSGATQASLIATYRATTRTMLYTSFATLGSRGVSAFSLGAAAPIVRNVPDPGGRTEGFQPGILHSF